jgi:hypothetical protein
MFRCTNLFVISIPQHHSGDQHIHRQGIWWLPLLWINLRWTDLYRIWLFVQNDLRRWSNYLECMALQPTGCFRYSRLWTQFRLLESVYQYSGSGDLLCWARISPTKFFASQPSRPCNLQCHFRQRWKPSWLLRHAIARNFDFWKPKCVLQLDRTRIRCCLSNWRRRLLKLLRKSDKPQCSPI